MRWFDNDFHSWLRHSWIVTNKKSLANFLTSDQIIVIHGNSCIILYILRCLPLARQGAKPSTAIVLNQLEMYKFIAKSYTNLCRNTDFHCNRWNVFRFTLLSDRPVISGLITYDICKIFIYFNLDIRIGIFGLCQWNTNYVTLFLVRRYKRYWMNASLKIVSLVTIVLLEFSNQSR